METGSCSHTLLDGRIGAGPGQARRASPNSPLPTSWHLLCPSPSWASPWEPIWLSSREPSPHWSLTPHQVLATDQVCVFYLPVFILFLTQQDFLRAHHPSIHPSTNLKNIVFAKYLHSLGTHITYHMAPTMGSWQSDGEGQPTCEPLFIMLCGKC